MFKIVLRKLFRRQGLKHPFELHPFASRVATSSYEKLILRFAFILCAASASLGILHSLATWNWTPAYVAGNAIQYALALLDFGEAPEKAANTPIAVQFVWLIAAFMKLLLVVFVLGIIVFKFLVLSDVFVARKKAAVFFNEELQEWELALRVYNATKIEILDIKFETYLRVPKVDEHDMTSVPNSVVRIRDKPDRSRWPIAIPFVPYTVNIPLLPGDVYEDRDARRLVAIQGRPIIPVPNANRKMPTGHAFLVLVIHAKTPELSGEIVETHWFNLSGEEPHFGFGKFEEIEVIAGTKPKRAGSNPEQWKGWERFEMNGER